MKITTNVRTNALGLVEDRGFVGLSKVEEVHVRSGIEKELLLIHLLGKNDQVTTNKKGSHSGDSHKKKGKTRTHVTLDEDVFEALESFPFNKSRLINALLRWFIFGEEVKFMRNTNLWSRDRDLNPGPADYESAALPS